MADLQSAALATWLRRRASICHDGCNLGNVYRSVKPLGLIFFLLGRHEDWMKRRAGKAGKEAVAESRLKSN